MPSSRQQSCRQVIAVSCCAGDHKSTLAWAQIVNGGGGGGGGARSRAGAASYLSLLLLLTSELRQKLHCSFAVIPGDAGLSGGATGRDCPTETSFPQQVGWPTGRLQALLQVGVTQLLPLSRLGTMGTQVELS